MTDNIITWNLANWITIVLMALIGFLALGALVAVVKRRKQNVASDALSGE